MNEEVRSKRNKGEIQKRKRDLKILVLVVAVLAVAILAIVLRSQFKMNQEKQKNAKGVAYLKSLEEQDVAKVQKKIKSASASVGLEQADTDEAAIWAAMADEYILGDSRSVGFTSYELMSEDHVFAKSGGKITDAVEYLDQLKALQPTEIFLCYGLNDVGLGIYPTGDDYATAYEEQVNTLKESLPDTAIYISSILPATGEGLEADPNYPRIDEYNEALEKMCEKTGWTFVDCTEVAEAHTDLYQPDGLHLQKEFYKYWCACMLAAMQE